MGCFAAGANCPLYLPSDTSADDIESRVWDLMEALDKKPRGVVTPTGQMTIIRGQDLSTFFGVAGYSPIGGFQLLGAIIGGALYDVWDPFFSVQESFREIPRWQDGCAGSDLDALAAPPPDYIAAIMCSEAGDMTDRDVEWWVDYALEQEEVSRIYGHSIVHIRLSCSSWPYRAAHTFNGPFTHPPHDPAGVAGKPAAPLLVLNTRVDPVSPVRAARGAAAKFPGAGLIVQDSLGHTAVLSAPSNCTDNLVRDYFHTGVVPDGEVSCAENCGPWDAGCTYLKTAESTGAKAKRVDQDVPEVFSGISPVPVTFWF